MLNAGTYFPRQKISDEEKEIDEKKWYKDNVDASLNAIYISEKELHRKMQIWNDLDNGIIDQAEIEAVFNPMGLESGVFPIGLKHYPKVTPKIDLLQGEELNRDFKYTVKSTNPGNNSRKLDEKVTKIIDYVSNTLRQTYMMNNGIDPNVQLNKQQEQELNDGLQKFLGEIEDYYEHDYKELCEIVDEKLLRYIYREQDLHLKLNRGFRDGLVMRREVYRLDNISDTLQVTKCDPRNVFFLERYDPYILEKSGRIVEVTYEPVSKIIDEFYEELTPDEIDQLESLNMHSSSAGKIVNYTAKMPNLLYGNIDGTPASVNTIVDSTGFLSEYDTIGNIRVIRARWTGRRRMSLVELIDENGDAYEDVKDDKYKPNSELGEKFIKHYWVNEMYEGVKIGNYFYKKLRPLEIQSRGLNNASKCSLGYVATDYGWSMHGKTESYQYMGDIYMNRLELLLAKYKGPMYELDLNKIPEDWDLDKWMYYAEVLGWAPIDNFNEVRKGAATGKLAGNFNTTGKVLDANPGQIFSQIIALMEYVDKTIQDITGVSNQRLGQMQSRETAQGIERSVTQSSFSTEYYFALHDDTKRRLLLASLDYMKMIYAKSDNKKVPYLLNDEERIFLEMSAEDIASSETDIFTSNFKKDMEIKNLLTQMVVQMSNSDKDIGLLIECINDDNTANIARKLKTHESRMRDSDQANSQAQQESQEKMAAAVEASKDKDREIKVYEIEKNYEIEMAKLGQGADSSVQLRELDIKDKLANIKQQEADIKKTVAINDDKNTQRELDIKNKQVIKSNATKK